MDKQSIFKIERPAVGLMHYYMLVAVPGLVLMPIVFMPMYFKYKTLRYRFDEKGISMSWGVLFRREIYLTYKKIQDIHLTRNIAERWMGLGKLHIQTASGSVGSEMVLQGIPELESLRDFIYSQMKGIEEAREHDDHPEQTSEKLILLTNIHEQLVQINAKLEAGRV